MTSFMTVGSTKIHAGAASGVAEIIGTKLAADRDELQIFDDQHGFVSEHPVSNYVESAQAADIATSIRESYATSAAHLLETISTERHSFSMKRFTSLSTDPDRLCGWRGTLKMLCMLSWLMLSANILGSVIMTIMSEHQRQYNASESVVMMDDSCTKIKKVDMIVHLFMNIFSAALLGGTNFAMQAWAAPTRVDIDRIHKSGGTADIGIFSLRNLFHIRPQRLIMWTTLLVTTLPLHLVYNSAISSTTSRPVYSVVVVSPEYLTHPFEVTRDSVVPQFADQQKHGNLTRGVHFDLQDTHQWRKVSIKSIKKDLKAKASSYGGVVVIADQNATRATRDKMSEPVSGILYHRVEPAGLYSDKMAYWLSDITIIATTDAIVTKSDGNSYWETVEELDLLSINWNKVDSRDSFWGQLCYDGASFKDDVHCYIDDYLGVTNRSVPSTPVFSIHSDVWVRKIDPNCRLLAEPIFWWLTAFCNLVIAVCLSAMAWFYKSAPLVTIGDAIDSFITEPPSPDSKKIPRSSCTYNHKSFTNIFRPPLPPRAYNPKATPLWKSVSLTRWSLTMVWFLYILSQCILFFAKALSVEDTSAHSLKSFFTFYLNSMDSDHTLYQIDGSEVDIISRRWRLVLIANTPQIFLSLTYLFFNDILTKMVAEREWHSFYLGGGSEGGKKKKKTGIHLLGAARRKVKEKKTDREPSPSPNPKTKTLRTSQPRGAQRSTFFLSLPYRYALPFFIVSSVMHWLMSQCLSFTEMDFVDLDGITLDKSNPTTSTLGYSTWAMFWVILLGTLSWVTILGLAVFGRYPAGMPLMGGCSGVVAAACHPPLGRRVTPGGESSGDAERNWQQDDDGDENEERDADIAAGPLSWGVIRDVVVRDGKEVEEKWLGFTRGEAEKPAVGEVYG